ncbi:unnamed protein product [Schistocephalus solidus]|uniref:Transmembrane protein n=2 Tax=Schistocephalus solidus TaxID=70667 RepID=A0A183TJM6_SCHSO|nr:unnamed protein product [Schistocephalus solidus]
MRNTPLPDLLTHLGLFGILASTVLCIILTAPCAICFSLSATSSPSRTVVPEFEIHSKLGASLLNRETVKTLATNQSDPKFVTHSLIRISPAKDTPNSAFLECETRTSVRPQWPKLRSLFIDKRNLLASAQRRDDETQSVTRGSPATKGRVMVSRRHSTTRGGAGTALVDIRHGTSFWQEFVAILRDINRGKLNKALEYENFLDACCVREVLRPMGGGHFNSNCCSRLTYLLSLLRKVKTSIRVP